MQGISKVSAPTTMSAPVSTKAQMAVSVMKMEQDHQKAQGAAEAKMIASASEVQMTGKGGRVDVTG